MSRHAELSAWVDTVSTHLPHLRGPQATVLALWSFGTAVVGTCGRSTVAGFLAALLGRKDKAVDQQLREFPCEAPAKKGDHRQALEVRTCFADLLQWVLSLWPPTEHRLALALDATTFAQRFTILVVCVLYGGTAIPLAWVVLPATQPGAWKRHWQRLLHSLAGQIPSEWTVLVLADRGLYAAWLYRALRRQGWHPFLRINTNGYYRRRRPHAWHALATIVPWAGTAWCGEIMCFKSHPLRCTLVAAWEPGYAEPWLIVTDLAPEQADVGWYALRTWIECSFKTLKHGAWQWQTTRMQAPERASRLWLVLAVATLWTVGTGTAAEATAPVSNLLALPPRHSARQRASGQRPPRKLSLVRRGRLALLARLFRHEPLCGMSLHLQPWPRGPTSSTLAALNRAENLAL